jgi:O-antigen ligase
MALLIGLMLAVQMILDVTKFEFGLAPGLSLKNVLLYLAVTVVGVRIALARNTHFEVRNVQVAWMILIGYAITTWAMASTVLAYQPYPVMENALLLKSGLADYFLYFLVCFYGLRSEQETITALKVLLGVVSGANLLTLTDTVGITDFGLIIVRDDGRTQGALGESNQYAAFLAFFIPLLAAVAYTSRGKQRLAWSVCALMAGACMMMTVSRGGFVGFGAALVIGAWLFRNQLPIGKLVAAAIGSTFLLLIVMFAVDANFRALIMERLVEGAMKADPGGISSGRADIWSDAVGTMLQNPLTLLTGFGWQAYFSMPFEAAPHNTYLNFWFNLGLPGLTCLLVSYYGLFSRSLFLARRRDMDPTRYWYIAFCVGTIGICVAVFFVELYQGWVYVWSCAGMMMRLALLKRAALPAREPVLQKQELKVRYGWGAKAPAMRNRV